MNVNMETWPDVRRKRCVRCGGSYLPKRGNPGYCSDRCYVLSRGRQEPQNASLSRAMQRVGDRRESRAAARYRVDGYLQRAALDNDIKAWRRERGETLGLIARMSGDRELAAERRMIAGPAVSTRQARRPAASEDGPYAPGGVISRSLPDRLSASQCAYIHETGRLDGTPHLGGCQPRSGAVR